MLLIVPDLFRQNPVNHANNHLTDAQTRTEYGAKNENRKLKINNHKKIKIPLDI